MYAWACVHINWDGRSHQFTLLMRARARERTDVSSFMISPCCCALLLLLLPLRDAITNRNTVIKCLRFVDGTVLRGRRGRGG